MKTVLPIAVALYVGAAASFAVSAAQQAGSPTFDVVSVRPNNRSVQVRGNIEVQPGGRMIWTNVTLEELIDTSYQRSGFDRRELLGGPDWIGSTRFDVVAQAPAGAALTDPDGFPGPVFAMVRAMLADRFKLLLHEEQRERPIYVLTPARDDGQLGPRLKRSSIDCAVIERDMAAGRRQAPPTNGPPPCAFVGLPGEFGSVGLDMTRMANALSGLVGRPVVDRTGLAGAFDWEMEFAPESAVSNADDVPAATPSDKPSIFSALREQLGLKLESARGPVSVLVVDRAELPTPN